AQRTSFRYPVCECRAIGGDASPRALAWASTAVSAWLSSWPCPVVHLCCDAPSSSPAGAFSFSGLLTGRAKQSHPFRRGVGQVPCFSVLGVAHGRAVEEVGDLHAVARGGLTVGGFAEEQVIGVGSHQGLFSEPAVSGTLPPPGYPLWMYLRAGGRG